MDKISEIVSRFLEGYPDPGEDEIAKFADGLALENPSLDIDVIKRKLKKLIKQGKEIASCEKELSALNMESPKFTDLEAIIKEAKAGQQNLEDITEELKNARKLIKSLRSSEKERSDRSEEEIIKEQLLQKAESSIEELKKEPSNRSKDGKPKKQSKRSGKKGTREKPEEPLQIPAEEVEIEPDKKVQEHEKADIEIDQSIITAQQEGMETPSVPDKEQGEETNTLQEEKAQDNIEKNIPDSTETESPSEKLPGEEIETAEPVPEPEESPAAIEQASEEKPTWKARRAKKEEQAMAEDNPTLEGVDGLMARLDMDNTKELIKEQLTPEKQAVFELLEEKLMSDVETRIKKLKEMQSKVLVEKPSQNFIGKMKAFLAKEPEPIDTYDPALYDPLVTFEGLTGFNEIERYWVNEPYSFVIILFNPENNSYLYYVAEPTLSDFEDLFLKEIKDRLKDVLLVEDAKSDEDKENILKSKVRLLVKDYAIEISPTTLEKVLYYTKRDFINFGKIDPLMHDDRIEDISANGHDIPIYLYHKKYTNIPTNIYYTENELNSYVIRLAQRCGKHISIADPMVDATMPDGSRIQMTLGTEVTSRGATFTIRKFSEVPITPVDLINWNTFSAEEMAYLWLCIENNKSLIFAGGTASGKTSSLNAVSLFIPPQAKIVTLEDTRELKLPHPNWIPGITRDSFTADGRGSIDMYELLRAALRQRPEYLLVGEVRGKEALTLFQAMSTGHTTFSTMHADSVSSAIHRLENPPISVPRTMIQALNIISIQAQTYVKGKRARRNMKLVEITDIDPTTRNIRTNDIFVWDPLTDKFQRVGESKALNEIMIRRGWSLSDVRNELMNRQKILDFMVTNKITNFNAISTIIHDYQSTPDKILKKLNLSG